MKTKDTISDILDITPIDVTVEGEKLPTTYKAPKEDDDYKQIDTDTRYVRQNMYDLIEKGHGAIDELLAVADQSQHPRAYEVLANMIKTMGDMNKDLIDMHEKKKKLKQDVDAPEEKSVTNNNLFVGSTSELLNLMNKNNDTD